MVQYVRVSPRRSKKKHKKNDFSATNKRQHSSQTSHINVDGMTTSCHLPLASPTPLPRPQPSLLPTTSDGTNQNTCQRLSSGGNELHVTALQHVVRAAKNVGTAERSMPVGNEHQTTIKRCLILTIKGRGRGGVGAGAHNAERKRARLRSHSPNKPGMPPSPSVFGAELTFSSSASMSNPMVSMSALHLE